MNWQRGFFRAWILLAIIWAIGWALLVLPDANGKIATARMTDAELMVRLDECKLPPGVPAPPQGFYLTDCLKRMKQEGRIVEHWGGGDGYAEQAFRVTRAFSFELGLLFIPPLGLLLLGVMLGWVFGGFRKTSAQQE